MSDACSVAIDDVNPAPEVDADHGRVCMIIQTLIDKINGSSEHGVVGLARFAPGPATQQRHRHPNAGDFVCIASLARESSSTAIRRSR